MSVLALMPPSPLSPPARLSLFAATLDRRFSRHAAGTAKTMTAPPPTMTRTCNIYLSLLLLLFDSPYVAAAVVRTNVAWI